MVGSLYHHKNRWAGVIATALLLVANTPAQSVAQSVGAVDNSSPERQARGLLKSLGKIEYRTDLRARIAKTPLREGEQFSRDDVLIEFDCERYHAELKAAKAGANAAWIDYNSKKRLLTHQAIGKDEVRLAAAQASKASAEVEVREVINAECVITAPFDGRVVALNASAKEYPPTDQSILTILDDRQLEVEMVVPSNWLTWVKKGQAFDYVVDETRSLVSAKIDRIGAEVDPISQTVKIFSILAVEDRNILAGMSGTATFHGGS